MNGLTLAIGFPVEPILGPGTPPSMLMEARSANLLYLAVRSGIWPGGPPFN